RRPHGTLRAYRGQQRLSGTEILDLPGRQDITADVNFDDLRQWARELRWRTGEMKPLEDFAPGAPGAQAFRSLIFSRD
ncbi:MAG: hypothetical protein FGM15_08105, partial [Chthoniobacterales bacterium]|nr:hypothetical protein [Chthoniobacterales bacterium]